MDRMRWKEFRLAAIVAGLPTVSFTLDEVSSDKAFYD